MEWEVFEKVFLIIGILLATAAVVCLEGLNDKAKRLREPRLDWKTVSWWDLQGTAERITPLLAELDENEKFLASLRNCNTDGDLRRLVSIQWNGMSEEEQIDKSFLMDGFRDKENWIQQTINYQKDMICQLFEITGGIAEWHDKNMKAWR